MNDSLDPAARAALMKTLAAKVANLVAEQEQLAEQRAELLTQQRRNDRELADCRATARLFRLEVDIPAPDRELMSMRERELHEARRDAEERERFMRARNAAMHEAGLKAAAEAAIRAAADATAKLTGPVQVPVAVPMPGAVPVQEWVVQLPVQTTKRPPLRDFLAQRLTLAGPGGAKAADLREVFERTYGETIHEKTVGMTLYRMSKDKLVKRDGHTWFIADAPVGAEAVNPGVAAPGSDNSSG